MVTRPWNRIKSKWRWRWGTGDSLPDPLVRPRGVAVRHVLPQHTPQLPLTQDEDVIQALAPHTAEEPLAGGVRPWCPDGGAQDRDPATRRDAVERRPVLAVVVADEEAGALVERRGLAQLLGHPSVSRVARHPDVHHAARAEVDDAEREERPETEVDDLEEVAGPGPGGVIPQEDTTLLCQAS